MLIGFLCPDEFLPLSGSLCQEITWVKTIAYGKQEAFAGASVCLSVVCFLGDDLPSFWSVTCVSCLGDTFTLAHTDFSRACPSWFGLCFRSLVLSGLVLPTRHWPMAHCSFVCIWHFKDHPHIAVIQNLQGWQNSIYYSLHLLKNPESIGSPCVPWSLP